MGLPNTGPRPPKGQDSAEDTIQFIKMEHATTSITWTELTKSSAFAELFHRFYHSPDDEYRNKRMKLISRVVQNTRAIREGVGTTLAILSMKTYQKHFRGAQYLDIDYDIGSSMVAASLWKMLLGYSRNLIIDLAFVLEGQTREELSA